MKIKTGSRKIHMKVFNLQFLKSELLIRISFDEKI